MHYKRTNFLKNLAKLRAYLKEYKRISFSLLCVFVLFAAYVLTTHTNAEIRKFENYTYVESKNLSTDTMQYVTLAQTSKNDAYIINDHNNIKSVKVFTDKNSEGVEDGTITPNTNYLKIKVGFNGIHADVLETQYNCSFRYNLPEFFRSTSTTERPIVDKNNKQIGTIHVENRQAIVTSYNTIYEIKERNTPDGYMKDDSSYYIICVDKGNSDDYTDYVKQCIAYFEKQLNKKYKVAYSSTDFNLTIYNSQKGIVVKKAFINNAAGISHKPVSGTYTFELYDNSEGTGSPLQVKTITYRTGETKEKTTKFINLNLNTMYLN